MKKESQIEKLASFIMNEVDGEPSQDEGAGDCAIRIIKSYKEQINVAKLLAEKFVNKVETGRARSKETYADCKNLLQLIK